MAFTFVKFPKKFLDSEEWQKPRKYSKAEALLYLLSGNTDLSLRHLAKQWQWNKTGVERFISELKKDGFWDTKWDTFRDTKRVNHQQVMQSFGTPNGTPNGTHIIENNNYPPVLSTTKVVSNTIPPKGKREDNPDYLKFLDWLKSNAPRVLQMKEPITEEQFISLKNDFDAQFLCDLLREMHNYEPLLKKNRSANLTLRNWAKRRKQWNNEQRTTNTAGNAEPDELLRHVAEGIARSRTAQAWQS